MDIDILDCTLRDGGYVNNWDFPLETAKKIISGLYDSGIRYIEIGIMGKGKKSGTKFVEFDDMKPLLEDRHSDCNYAAMATVNELRGFSIPKRSRDTVDILRVAFFKEDRSESLEIGKQLIEKGYMVFLQPMATFMYSDEELSELIRKVNEVKPAAVYMVDSFSNLYPDDVKKMAGCFLKELDKDICFGFHAHNNIQMAYANVIEFLSTDTDRKLFVDSSIFGMGRGAGNLPTELIMEYLNKRGHTFNVIPILKTYQDELEPIYEEYGWGYSHLYYLTAVKKMNSVYGWYLLNKGITDIMCEDAILNEIDVQDKHTLNKESIENAIKKIVDHL